MKNIFKPEHLYGQVLLFFFNNPDKRYSLDVLLEHFKEDRQYLETQLERLTYDGLSTKDIEHIPIYGLSYKGFQFLYEINSIKESRSSSRWSNWISALALLFSMASVYISYYKDSPPPVANVSNQNVIQLDSTVTERVLNRAKSIHPEIKVKQKRKKKA